MDERARALLGEKRKKLALDREFSQWNTMSFIGFEDHHSPWYHGFYDKMHSFNSIYSVPQFTRPYGPMDEETIQWVLGHLRPFQEETAFLWPVVGELANVEVTSFSDTMRELLTSGTVLCWFMASKRKGKIFHIFDHEYERELFLADLSYLDHGLGK